MARLFWLSLLAVLSGGALAVPRGGSHAVSSADVRADARKAFEYALKNITTSYECGWTRGTYMIGLWDYYTVTGDEEAGTYLKEWAKSYKCAFNHHQHTPESGAPTDAPCCGCRCRWQLRAVRERRRIQRHRVR